MGSTKSPQKTIPEPGNKVALILRISLVAMFGGYAWLCFSGHSPSYVFFWNEALLSPLISFFFGIDWTTYATSIATSQMIDHLVDFIGIIFVLGGMAAFCIHRFPVPARVLIILCAIQILVWAILSGIDRVFFIVQFAEYALQWSAPVFFIATLRVPFISHKRFYLLLRAASAITFAAHGLYAVGVFPRPGQFTEMTMSILQLSESGAIWFLTIAGALDLLAAIGLFIPFRPVQKTALWYMVIWGLLTTLARWVAHVHFQLPWWPDALMEWTPQVLVRFPHFLGPLALLYISQKS